MISTLVVIIAVMSGPTVVSFLARHRLLQVTVIGPVESDREVTRSSDLARLFLLLSRCEEDNKDDCQDAQEYGRHPFQPRTVSGASLQMTAGKQRDFGDSKRRHSVYKLYCLLWW